MRVRVQFSEPDSWSCFSVQPSNDFFVGNKLGIRLSLEFMRQVNDSVIDGCFTANPLCKLYELPVDGVDFRFLPASKILKQ